MKTMPQNVAALLIAGLLAFAAVAFAFSAYIQQAYAGSGNSSNLPSTIATTSNPTVGLTPVLVFATSTCASRIITTYANPIMMTFSDIQGKVPTGTFGHLQAASTTVVYDSNQYGCGAVRILGFTANLPITVSESR